MSLRSAIVALSLYSVFLFAVFAYRAVSLPPGSEDDLHHLLLLLGGLIITAVAMLACIPLISSSSVSQLRVAEYV